MLLCHLILGEPGLSVHAFIKHAGAGEAVGRVVSFPARDQPPTPIGALQHKSDTGARREGPVPGGCNSASNNNAHLRDKDHGSRLAGIV